MKAAFLFDSQHPSLGSFYGPPCTGKVMRALEKITPSPRTLITRGDLLPELLAYRISSVSRGRSRRGNLDSSSKLVGDKDRFVTVICDLAQSLTCGFNTIKEMQFLDTVGRGRVWAVVLPTVTRSQVARIDAAIIGFKPYLGFCEVDTGNPLHIRMFTLPDDAFFGRGRLHYRHDQMAFDAQDAMNNARRFGARKKPVLMDPAAFEKSAPAGLTATRRTKRGALSANRLAGKSTETHQERVAKALLDFVRDDNGRATEFDFTVQPLAPGYEFICEERKIKDYLLNKDHPEGGAKAKFFSRVLAIERDDWRYLADQIAQGMKTAELFRVKDTTHGISHGAFLLVNGRNGKSAVIQSGWEIKAGAPARLVTAYPEEKFRGDKLVAGADNVVLPTLAGDQKWRAVYERACAAGLRAAAECVPTPMVLDGYSPIFEGACGFAWVAIPNARTGFGLWLRKNNIGSRGHPSGRSIWVNIPQEALKHGDAQSVEPKTSYANAFAEVLRANGIPCSIESRLD